MKNIDLTSQFILFIAITLIAVIGAMNFWFYHDHTSHLTETLENRAAAKMDFLDSSTGYYLTHFENELIVELGKKTMHTDPGVLFLSIEGADGVKLFEEGSTNHKDSRTFSQPIINDDNNIGALKLTLDIRQLIADRHDTMLYTTSLMIFSVSLIGGMIYLFYRRKILHEFNIIHNEKEFLRDEHEFIMSIINTASNMVVVLDKYGYILLANQIFANALGSETDSLMELHIASTIDFDCDGHKMRSEESSDIVADFEDFSENLLQKHCTSILCLNSTEVLVEWKFNKLIGENGQTKSLIGTGIDITVQRQKQLELSHRANHDHLTSLPNRTLFNERLQESFNQSKQHLAMLFIDLDHFKPINDKYGHEAGDLVLKIVSRRMQSTIRETDTVARLGGDEFGMLLLDVQRKENISRITEKLLSVISNPITYGEKTLSVGASIGISIYSEKIKDIKELVSQADDAMYQAKTAGRNNYRYFDNNAAKSSDINPALQSASQEVDDLE